MEKNSKNEQPPRDQNSKSVHSQNKSPTFKAPTSKAKKYKRSSSITGPLELAPKSLKEQTPSVSPPSFESIESNFSADTKPHEAPLSEMISSEISTRMQSHRDFLCDFMPLKDHAIDIDQPIQEYRTHIKALERDPNDINAFVKAKGLLSKSQRWVELTELLIELISKTNILDYKVTLLVYLAEIFDVHLKSPEQALVALTSAFLLDPTRNEIGRSIGELCHEAQLWSQLFSELGIFIAQEERVQRRASMCAFLGDWYIQAGHIEYAFSCYEQALSFDPQCLRSLSGMSIIYELVHDFPQLDKVLEYITFPLPEAVAPEVLLRIVGLLERRGHISKASEVLEKGLDQHPSNALIMKTFVRIFGTQDQWSHVAMKLSSVAHQASLNGKDEDAFRMWKQAASINAHELNNLREAEKICKLALDINESDDELLAILEIIYTADSKWKELLSILEKRIDLCTSNEERVRCLNFCAKILTENFQNYDIALEYVGRALEIDPRSLEAHHHREKILKIQEKWLDLAEAYEEHSVDIKADSDKAELIFNSALIRIEKLGQINQGIQLLQKAIKIIPHNVKYWGSLGQAHATIGNYTRAFDSLIRQSKLTQDHQKRSVILTHAARLMFEHLDSPKKATKLLKQAIDLDPSHMEPLELLRKIRMFVGDWNGTLHALEMEIEASTDSIHQGKLLLKHGQILRYRLNRENDALFSYQKAREILGDTEEVLRPLYELNVSIEQFDKASDLAIILMNFLPREDSEIFCRESINLSEICLKAKKTDNALKILEYALSIDPAHPDILLNITDIYESVENWEEARKALISYSNGKKHLGRLDATTNLRLAKICRNADRKTDAKKYFKAVLKDKKDSHDALFFLAEMAQSKRRFKEAIKYLERITLDKDDEKIDHLRKIAKLARQARNVKKCQNTLEEILEIAPNDHRALTDLLEIYSNKKDWSKALDTIFKLADTAKGNPKLRSKYYLTAAKIYRDKKNNLEASVKMFNKALDDDWTNLTEFHALDKLLTKSKEYVLQKDVYKQMINRVTGKGSPQLEARLWHLLGEIYRTRLNRFNDSAKAFAIASKIEPENTERYTILIELYQALGEYQKAIECYKKLLKLHPGNIKILRSLFGLCIAADLEERAFCIVSFLVSKNRANSKEKKYYQQYPKALIIDSEISLQEESWLRLLRHKDENPYISAIFESITPLVFSQQAQPLKNFSLSDKTLAKTDDEGDESLSFLFRKIVKIFGLKNTPQLHISKQQIDAISYAVSNPISSVANATIKETNREQKIFLFARHLVYYRGGYYMTILCPSVPDLTGIFTSIVADITENKRIILESNTPLVHQITIKETPFYEKLRHVVHSFIKRGGNADINRWIKGIEFTACRAALLCVEDIRVAIECIRLSSFRACPISISSEELIEDLTQFLLSENYLTLRNILKDRIENC